MYQFPNKEVVSKDKPKNRSNDEPTDKLGGRFDINAITFSSWYRDRRNEFPHDFPLGWDAVAPSDDVLKPVTDKKPLLETKETKEGSELRNFLPGFIATQNNQNNLGQEGDLALSGSRDKTLPVGDTNTEKYQRENNFEPKLLNSSGNVKVISSSASKCP